MRPVTVLASLPDVVLAGGFSLGRLGAVTGAQARAPTLWSRRAPSPPMEEDEMDTVLFDDAAKLDKATMIDRVATYARRYYGGEAAEDDLQRWAAAAVARVWGDGVLVPQFVPTLALREVRERVRLAHEGRSAA